MGCCNVVINNDTRNIAKKNVIVAAVEPGGYGFILKDMYRRHLTPEQSRLPNQINVKQGRLRRNGSVNDTPTLVCVNSLRLESDRKRRV